MTSKEALENLYNMACVEAGQKQQFITYAREIEHNEIVEKYYNIIKQDLEHLEQLEKELQERKEANAKVLTMGLNKTIIQIENLKLENQDLKEQLKLEKDSKGMFKVILGLVDEENEKLKKAIDKEIILLKERREIFWFTDSYDEYAVVNEIIEELEEVLNNDK